ncbi:MAG: biotin--[acetyl-CoA-carboxylase] ligase [Vicinamibacterales bacterium]|nr:biotin--[acetyl-CoA-carboxylase] ligase [Vicinamibacterales bacterium]
MPSPLPFEIHHRPVVTSTMDVAAAEAAQGAAEGWTLVADEQTAGRGRRGREWTSPAGAGVYLSVVLRPPVAAGDDRLLSLLTLAVGVGVRDGLQVATGLAPDVKWPNDVFVGRRKLAGILAEGLALGTPAQCVVVGVGINLRTAAYPPDVAAVATSLEAELGRVCDRDLVIDEVLAGVGRAYGDLKDGRAGDILRRWREASPWAVGTRVEWESPSGPQTGETAGIDETGALLVRTTDGIARVIAGEVRWKI